MFTAPCLRSSGIWKWNLGQGRCTNCPLLELDFVGCSDNLNETPNFYQIGSTQFGVGQDLRSQREDQKAFFGVFFCAGENEWLFFKLEVEHCRSLSWFTVGPLAGTPMAIVQNRKQTPINMWNIAKELYMSYIHTVNVKFIRSLHGSYWITLVPWFCWKKSPGGLSALGMWRQGIKLREFYVDSKYLCIAMHLIEQIPFFRFLLNCCFHLWFVASVY